MSSPDLLIIGGMVHTGDAGAEPVRADVAIAGDRIVDIRPGLSQRGAQVLDASGCIVCPGFVDIHAHSDQAALTFPGAECKVCDGVTTELNGNCGLTVFPQPLDLTDPPELRATPARWSNAAAFMAKVEEAGSAINRVYLMGHGALRTSVIGLDDRPPTADELALMRCLVADAMDQGAIGLSSGLAYAPGCFAKQDELIALCRVVAKHGGLYATHIRNEGDQVVESIEEALEVARGAGVRLQIGHLKTLGRSNWPKIGDIEKLLRGALESGVDVAADRYPYLACATGLRAMFSLWLMDGGPEKAVARLRDPACRRRLSEERSTEFGGEMLWESVVIASTKTEKNRAWIGHPIAGIARQRGQDPLETALDLLAEEETAVGVRVFAMGEENLARLMNWPFVMVGSDSGARDFQGEKGVSLPHPRAFGSFSRVLGRLVRQQRTLPLPLAIAKMTTIPAQRIGLRDRGRLTPGAYADITVFDPATILDTATYEDPFHPPEGIRHVLTNGGPILQNAALTQARPGRVLRLGPDITPQPAPPMTRYSM